MGSSVVPGLPNRCVMPSSFRSAKKAERPDQVVVFVNGRAVETVRLDRSGSFEDPFGHHWNVATHVEDVPQEEMAKRAEEAMAGG